MCLAKYAVTSSIALILLWEEAVLRFILPHLECIARLALSLRSRRLFSSIMAISSGSYGLVPVSLTSLALFSQLHGYSYLPIADQSPSSYRYYLISF